MPKGIVMLVLALIASYLVLFLVMSLTSGKKPWPFTEDDDPNKRKAGVPVYEPGRDHDTFKIDPTEDTGQTWWCAMDVDGKCDRSVLSCDQRRRDVIGHHGNNLRTKVAPCTGADAAACITMTKVLTKVDETNCYSTMTACNSARDDRMIRQGADWTIATDCHPEGARFNGR